MNEMNRYSQIITTNPLPNLFHPLHNKMDIVQSTEHSRCGFVGLV